jgi:hypothetical protein
MKMRFIQRCESLIPVAKSVGIAVPDDLFDNSPKFRHWALFCAVQIERPVTSDDALLHNAKIIAAIPIDHLESTFKFEEISGQLK